MEKINWRRVLLGGMLAGIVLIVLAAASTAIFMGPQKLKAVIQALRPSTGGSTAPLFFIFVFLFLGILMIGAYAAILPRFGPGSKTAAVAGLSIWLIGVWLSAAGFVLKSIVLGEPFPLPSGPMLPCIYLAMMVISTLAGASVYQEQRS